MKTTKEWNDWHWQIANSITSYSQLKKIINLSWFESIKTLQILQKPLRITPYFAKLIDKNNTNDPLRRTVVPSIFEFKKTKGEKKDPLDEEKQSPVKGLVHRYPDRVLLLTTSLCATYCRYCNRKRLVGKKKGCYLSFAQCERIFDYIKSNKNIRDVLFSGGDPLILEDEHLDYLLKRVKSIPNVEVMRISTRIPVVLPYRITRSLLKILKKYQPLWVNIHFTHPCEITDEVEKTCNRLADSGIPLGSQTVLLKDINDNPEVLKKLFHKLVRLRVRPYYLFQCERVIGSAHFRTEINKGLEIISSLIGHTSGFAVPAYVMDTPRGKVQLLPGLKNIDRLL
ncbi:MAG: KamA family radical SAM protein [Candidatus Hydrogenedentota bacterium]